MWSHEQQADHPGWVDSTFLQAVCSPDHLHVLQTISRPSPDHLETFRPSGLRCHVRHDLERAQLGCEKSSTCRCRSARSTASVFRAVARCARHAVSCAEALLARAEWALRSCRLLSSWRMTPLYRCHLTTRLASIRSAFEACAPAGCCAASLAAGGQGSAAAAFAVPPFLTPEPVPDLVGPALAAASDTICSRNAGLNWPVLDRLWVRLLVHRRA